MGCAGSDETRVSSAADPYFTNEALVTCQLLSQHGVEWHEQNASFSVGIWYAADSALPGYEVTCYESTGSAGDGLEENEAREWLSASG